MDDLKFTRIKIPGAAKSVELEWLVMRGVTPVKSEVDAPVTPDPDFVNTLRAFKPELLRVLQLPPAYGEDMEVHQVSPSYPRGRRGIVISAKKPLSESNSPLMLHSPWLPEPPEDGGSGGGMSSAMIDLLDKLEHLAAFYLDQLAAQRELELPATNGKKRVRQTDIEDASNEGEKSDTLPPIGAKLKFSGDLRRVYRILQVSSERIVVDSKDGVKQSARIDQLRRSGDAWFTDYLYDVEGELAPTTTEDAPV